MPEDTVCGVLLYEEAYSVLGDAIMPYVKEGRIGKYIYCAKAIENGSFIDMTFFQAGGANSIKEKMVVSVPTRFVKIMVAGHPVLPLGFAFD